MSTNRLSDYINHMRQAATEACGFVAGLSKDGFLADRRTQQAAIMNLVIIGEAATKVMADHGEFAQAHPGFRGAACEVCATASRTVISISISTWSGTLYRQRCRN